MKPAFPYSGGKTKLLGEILPFFPRGIRTYIEPFAGGLAVLLAHDKPFPREIINDLDSDLIAFYRVAAAHPEALIAELALKSASREEFYNELAFPSARTELGRAARWFWLTRTSFGSKRQHFGRGRDMFHGVDVARERETILALSARLRNAVFRSADARKILGGYDADDAFFFLDPPYVSCADVAYEAFSEDDMRSLRDALLPLRAKWLLTCDDSPQTRRVFSGFHARGTKIRYSLAREKSGKISDELMVFSANLAADFPGETSLLAPAPEIDDGGECLSLRFF